MSAVCIVFTETKNSTSALWPSRRDATSFFIASVSRSKIAHSALGKLIFCLPDTAESLPEMPTAEAASRLTGIESHVIECRKRGEAYGFREALRMVQDASTVVYTLCYPGSVDWEALELAVDEFQANERLRVVSFRSEFDPESTRGLENIFVRACALKTVSESAMFSTLTGTEGHAWCDVMLGMCERLLITQREIKRLDWTKDEGILPCDPGDRVVFAEHGGPDKGDTPLLTVFGGRIEKVHLAEKKASIVFQKSDGKRGREKVGFHLFRVVRRYTPVCFLEDFESMCYGLRGFIGNDTITHTELFSGLREILETLNRARVLCLLTEVTLDATQTARAYFSNTQNMAPDVVEGVIALSKIDGVRQTAELTGNVCDFPMEEACSRTWEGRGPIRLMARANADSCDVEELSVSRLLENRHPWFSGIGFRATRAFLLAYCGKAKVSLAGL